MARANPTAVKTAISTDGATFSSGMLVHQGVAKYLRLDTTDPDNPVWVLDPASGVRLYNKTQFNLIKNNTVLSDPGEYQWCIATGGGAPIGQLAQQTIDGTDYAIIADP